jgi:S-adenosylmethionine hydrolase
MPIITLTTDLGGSDYYVGALKGSIITRSPEARIVDITHHIPPFDVQAAAYVIRHAWQEFPPKTIHLVWVESGQNPSSRNIIIAHQEHLFVGPDNGLFAIVFDDEVEAFAVSDRVPTSFPSIDSMVDVIAGLAAGRQPGEFGQRTDSFIRISGLNARVTPEGIRCNVIHVDHYGNAVLNLSRKTFEEALQHRNFVIQLRGNNTITALSRSYSERLEGDALCLFNRSGLMEIAINCGNAGSMLGLQVGETVRIDFD